jgi:hypothetical protein
MKRVVFLVTLALVYCLATSAGFCQGWTPEPPPSVMPQAGFPMPLMGQPGMMPGMNSSCAPPCMPMSQCGPCRPGSVAGLLGWQFGDDPGGVKFSTRGHHLIQKTGTMVDFDLSGLWAGVSGRVQPSDTVSLRAEYRHFFPSKESSGETTTSINVGAPGKRIFSRSRYQWNVLDASAGLNLTCGVSLLGGFRWDSLYLSMAHPPVINLLSTNADEGDLTLSTLIPYGGAEFAWMGCDGGLLLRLVGTPWLSTSTKFGLTFGNGGNTIRGPIRDHMSVNSKFGSFVEASVYAGRRVSKEVTAGVFGMITSLSAHSQGDMQSTRQAGTDPLYPTVSVSSPFDVDMTRWTFILGGNVAVGFCSPM